MLVPQLFYLSGYIDGLGDAVEKGLVKAVGVSNYNGKSLWLLYVWKSSILCKIIWHFYCKMGNLLTYDILMW